MYNIFIVTIYNLNENALFSNFPPMVCPLVVASGHLTNNNSPKNSELGGVPFFRATANSPAVKRSSCFGSI